MIVGAVYVLEPVNKDHPRDLEQVAFIGRWLLYAAPIY